MSCKPEISVVNTASSAVSVNGLIPLGSVVRKRGTKNCNCACPLELSGSSIVISESGYYDVDFSATFTAPVAGNVTISMLINGAPVAGFTATTTITTAATQVASVSISAPDIRVFCGNVPSTITFVVTGVAATFSNVALSVNKI